MTTSRQLSPAGLLRVLAALGLALTSQALAQSPVNPADDVLFIHHSVGQNWLADGLREALLAKDYIDEVNESYYGTVVAPAPGRPASLGDVAGNNTDMNSWLFWFNDYLPSLHSLGADDGRNRIILFKSCYPNSILTADGTAPGAPFSTSTRYLENNKAVFHRAANATAATYTRNGYLYRPLEEIFAEHPDTLFVFITPPPLNYDADSYPSTNDDYADRARRFNNWLKNEWLPQYRSANPGLHNVAVFDLFDFVAVPAGATTGHPNRLRPEYVRTDDPTDCHPNTTANHALTARFATGANAFLDAAWTEFLAGTPVALDQTPPTVPAGLATTIESARSVALQWAASTDPVVGDAPTSGVAGYRVLRDGATLGTASATSYRDTTAAPATSYSYAVVAFDHAGNASAPCPAVAVTTPPEGTPTSEGVPLGSGWRYFKGTAAPPAAWNEPSFDDTAWLPGATPFGYGDTTFATLLPDMANHYLTLYARAAFTWSGATVDSMTLQVDFDDGCLIYLNGVEVYRHGIAGAPLHDVAASGTHDEGNPITVDLTAFRSLLVPGNNVLAAYASNTAIMSSDFALTPVLQLLTRDDLSPAAPANLTGAPIAGTAVALSWASATDAGGIAEYRLYRNSGTTPCGTTSTTTFTDATTVVGSTYRYEVSAVDNAGNESPRSAPLEVFVHDETYTAYAEWAQAEDVSGDPLADPDGCGLSNFARYAFGLPARGAVGSPVASTLSGNGADQRLTLAFSRKGYAPGLQYTIQSSTDLVTWTDLQTVPPDYPKTFTFTDSVVVTSTPRRFLRVRVTAP